jgi:hypothetical protein
MRIKRGLVALMAAVSVSSGLAALPSGALASERISGQVTCLSGAPVVGVWVVAASGGSGWASYSYEGAGWYRYSFTLPRGGSYSLHVGCGGSTSRWAMTAQTPYATNTSGTPICDDIRGSDEDGLSYGWCTHP